MDFLTGVNYWASNAGMLTFSNFDEKVIDKDFKFLSSYGVDTIRVFPLWPDFQPIENSYTNGKTFSVRKNGVPLEYLKYKSGLDEGACEKFKTLLNLAKKYNIKVIVALITGWMSGKNFIPEALKGENPITSKRAIVFECKFIKDFISIFKEYEQIIAWEFGNECNALSFESPEYDNELWLQTISSAIRLADNTRPVYAGMHGLTCSNQWTIQTVGDYSDCMTTHPYPLFTPYCSKEELTSMRACLHASAESEYYASISGKPCMVEEINTIGPMYAGGESAGKYLEKSYATSVASGTTGYLWWCGFDQDKLDFPPYDTIALEQNLGVAIDNETPRPTTFKLKEVAGFFKGVDNLSTLYKDLTFILSSEQDDWKIAYGSYVLALQSGHVATFAFENQPLKKSNYYVLPSITSQAGIPNLLYKDLLKNVENGAKVLITYNGGYIPQFEKFTGLEVQGRTEQPRQLKFKASGKEVEITANTSLLLKTTTATSVIEADGNVILSKNKVGKGEVYFLNAPLECFYTESYYPHETNLYAIYEEVFGRSGDVQVLDKKVAVFNYPNEKTAILVNFNSENTLPIKIDGKVKKVLNASISNGFITFEKDYAVIIYGE